VAAPLRKESPAPAPAPRPRGVGPGKIILIPTIILVIVAVIGARYYLEPPAERLRDPLHAWFRSSGYVGQSAGIATFIGFLFMWLFPLRKRFRKATWAGPVPRWLDVHIGVGMLLPLVGAIHAGFQVGGVIGIGYIAMLIVCASGIVGRYLYVRIPRSRSGIEMGLGEVAAQQRALVGQLSEATGISVIELQEILKVDSTPSNAGVMSAFMQMIRDDMARHRAARRIRARVKSRGGIDAKHVREMTALARRGMALGQHARLLNATQSIFRHWHAAHRPVAITAFIAVTIHVVVVIAVGATWF